VEAIGGVRPSYYTEAQAARGGAAFQKQCSNCHTVDQARPARIPYGGNLAGTRFASKRYNGRPLYPSVYYIWRKLEEMPADNTERVPNAEKLDILAYLLQQNGLPPGASELKADPSVMKSLLIDQPGFEHMFNGYDFTGLKFNLGFFCTPAPQGCGKTDPAPEFRIEDGMIVTGGKMHSMMYTEKKYLNYTLQLEQRFDYKWDDDEALFPGNSGVIAFMSDDARVWPQKMILVDGRYYDFMNIQAVGTTVKKMFDDDARRRAVKGPNEWQYIEIVSRNGEVKAWLNGTLVSSFTGDDLKEPTHIGFQNQGIPTRWRHIRIKPE
jgi:mono/diheme cytochrome c family protein